MAGVRQELVAPFESGASTGLVRSRLLLGAVVAESEPVVLRVLGRSERVQTQPRKCGSLSQGAGARTLEQLEVP